MRNDNKPWKRQGYKSGGRTGKQFGGPLAQPGAQPLVRPGVAPARPLGFKKGSKSSNVYRKGGKA